MNKKCTKCGEIKPLEDFVKNKACNGGRTGRCKGCDNKYKREYCNNPKVDEQTKVFYVYCHQTKDDGNCFYIGKGKNKRAYSKAGRNIHWKRKVAKHGGFDVVILVNNITEDKAFELEENFIAQIGRDNLVNMTDGGEGTSGRTFIMKDDHKAKIGKANKGVKKSPEHCKKISEANRGKMCNGTKVSQYNRDGVYIQSFSSIKEACEILSLSSGTISNSLRGKHFGEFIWRYDDSMNLDIEPILKYRKVDQYTKHGEYIRTFESIHDASTQLGVKYTYISNNCNNRCQSAGNYIWRFDGDTPPIIVSKVFAQSLSPSSNIIKNGNRLFTNIKIINQYSANKEFIQSFNSIAEAARYANVSYCIISSALRSKSNKAAGFFWKYTTENNEQTLK